MTTESKGQIWPFLEHFWWQSKADSWNGLILVLAQCDQSYFLVSLKYLMKYSFLKPVFFFCLLFQTDPHGFRPMQKPPHVQCVSVLFQSISSYSTVRLQSIHWSLYIQALSWSDWNDYLLGMSVKIQTILWGLMLGGKTYFLYYHDCRNYMNINCKEKSQIALSQYQVSKNQRWKRPISFLAKSKAQCRIAPLCSFSIVSKISPGELLFCVIWKKRKENKSVWICYYTYIKALLVSGFRNISFILPIWQELFGKAEKERETKTP